MFSHWELQIWYDILFLPLWTKSKKANLLHPRPTDLRSDTNFTTPDKKATRHNWGKANLHYLRPRNLWWDTIFTWTRSKKAKKQLHLRPPSWRSVTIFTLLPPGQKAQSQNYSIGHLKICDQIPLYHPGQKAKLHNLRPPDRRSDTMFTTP